MADLFAGRNVDPEAAQARMQGLMAEEGLPYGQRRPPREACPSPPTGFVRFRRATPTPNHPLKHEAHRTLWELTRGERLRYARAIVALAGAVAAIFAVPLLVRWALDGVWQPEALLLPAPLERLGAGLGWSRTTTLLVAAAAGGLLATALAGALQYLRGPLAATAANCVPEISGNSLIFRDYSSDSQG